MRRSSSPVAGGIHRVTRQGVCSCKSQKPPRCSIVAASMALCTSICLKLVDAGQIWPMARRNQHNVEQGRPKLANVE